VVRPGKPPTATFGNGTNLETDPVLRVLLPQANFDFYIWSTDRFIRFMTATFDLDVPVNLTVTKDGLLPVLDKIGVSNGVVTNSELLREDPEPSWKSCWAVRGRHLPDRFVERARIAWPDFDDSGIGRRHGFAWPA
jgi:hypothetical protein